MAKRKKPNSQAKKSEGGIKRFAGFFKSQQTHLVFGVLVFTSSIFLLISFYSFLQHWKEDQSILDSFSDKSSGAGNLLGKVGANLSHFFVYEGFGVSTFIFPLLLFFTGLYIILHIPVRQLFKAWRNGIMAMIWLSLGLAFVKPEYPLLGGKVGFELNSFLQIYIGRIGVFLLLLLTFLVFVITRFRITPQKIKSWMPKPKPRPDKVDVLSPDVTDEGFIMETALEPIEGDIELELDSYETVEPEAEEEERKKKSRNNQPGHVCRYHLFSPE